MIKHTKSLVISQYHPGTRWRLRVLRAILPISEEDVVLDAGCGDGYISSQLAKVAKEVVGVDVAQKIIEINKKYFDLPNLRFVKADLSDLKNYLSENLFSIVICTDVLEHTKGFKNILDNFFYVLKANGFLYLTIPMGKHGHFAYSEYEVIEVLNKKGFRVIHCEKIGPPPITLKLKSAFHWASDNLYGKSKESDVWTDTKAFSLAQKEPILMKLFRIFIFPIMNGLTYLDRNPYRSGNELLVLARKDRLIE